MKMMSKKQWLALLAVFVTYLLLGAAIFYHIEEPLEHERRREEHQELRHVQRLMTSFNYSAEFIDALETYCKKPMLMSGEEPQLEPIFWNFYNSFFFVITVVSTIGYGNLAPTCTLSRILMILYALIGIPMNGILLASLGEFFSMTLLRARHRHKHEPATYLLVDVMRYLVPGFVIFIFVPAAVFTYVEHDWTYDMGVYYAFVTLTTIGFGDLVAGQSSRGQNGVFVVYRIALIVWVVFGLGYLVMLLGFITRAMRSKKMARLEHKLAENLRMTQSKIWNGFTKDMSYLRRIINEMYLQKLKPVYRDEDAHPRAFQRTRSNSEPALPISSEPEFAQGEAVMWRRRANSEVISQRGLTAHRVLSESDLCRIDKDATFATATTIEPVEFLTRFVSAFGQHQEFIEEEDESERKFDMENGGIHGFTDEEILASEKWGGSGWTIGGSDVPRQQLIRGRAASEVRITMPDDKSSYNAEWTWSGDVASRRIHELIRARRKSMKSEKEQTEPEKVADTKRNSFSSSFFQLPKWRSALRSTKRRKKARSFSDMLFFQKAKRSQSLQEDALPSKEDNLSMTASQFNYLTQTGGRNPLQSYLANTAAGRRSFFSSTGGSNSDINSVLEETSLADFFRALSSIHSRVEPPAPRRKMGTASLTPPYSSLTSLFVPPNHSQRRFSLRPVPAGTTNLLSPNSPAAAAAQRRRSSLRPVPPTQSALLSRRRSSLRPPTPTGSPANSTFRRSSLKPTNTPTFTRNTRRFSVRPTVNPPPIPTRTRTLRQELFQRQLSDTSLMPRRTRHESLRDVPDTFLDKS